ncbi:lipopolysaccharide biosynthesis protein [Pseudalkalibacillus sp. R45]|uniref:lipopolysaccharide biosynthesis protein n=1 Tax=Pseudalkalibacillus sp. R45 TaxID=3457433 RepID=UPI003FCD79FB
MLNQLKRLGGDSLLYALMNVGTKLIAFLMLPIYTAYLGQTEMGVFDAVDAMTAMLTFFIIFGTDNALAFYYYDTEDEEKRDTYVETVLTFRLGISLILLAIALLFGPWISQLVTDSKDYAHVVYIAMIVLVFEAIITLILTLYRFQFKSLKVMIYTVLKLGLVALLSFIILKFFLPGVEAIYIGRVISMVVVVAFLVRPVIKYLRFKIDYEVLKKIVVYAAPLVPASLAFWVITFANRFFIVHFDGVATNGIYGVAVKFATVITLLTSSVQMAWRPYSMSIKEKPDAKKIFAKFYYILLILGIIGLLGIATVIPFVLKFMIPNPEFADATKYVALLSAGTFLNFYYLIISVGLFIEKETKPISYYFGITAVVSLILNVVLIPLFSLWGAAASVVLSYLLANIMIFRRSQQVYKVPVSVWKIAFLFINGMLAMLAIVYIQEFTELRFIWVFVPWVYFLLMGIISNIWKDIKV